MGVARKAKMLELVQLRDYRQLGQERNEKGGWMDRWMVMTGM